MPVRSKRLFGPIQAGTTGSTVYTCPAGETALIKQLDLGAGAVGGTIVSYYLNSAAAGNRLIVVSLAVAEWRSIGPLFLALHPGESLFVQTSTGTITTSGHGAELEGVAD